jgi:hypothetical protein
MIAEISVVAQIEFLCVLSGFSFANFAVKALVRGRKIKDFDRQVREGKPQSTRRTSN